ncbi:MAG: HAMP domain-containing histidine kinase [Pirellulales bacterium]|nr:HAMP domain-containing histidine kinase [Pirellulales bacterium]
MSDSTESFEERLQRAKLDAMKELAYGASHEINNPLANISARAQTLLRDERDPERRRALEAINQQALRAHEMISDLMLFARPPRLDARPVDLTAVIEQVVAEVSAECSRRGIETLIDADGALPEIAGDPVQLAVAVKAVIVNSIEAIGQGGRVEVAIKRLEDVLRIEVRDTGPGISPEVRTHMFDPFYSGREAGRGLGFGLPKAWRIVTAHGGQIWAESAGDEGALIVIELPSGAGRS